MVIFGVRGALGESGGGMCLCKRVLIVNVRSNKSIVGGEERSWGFRERAE